jgi:hypothetical protein
LTAGLIGAVVLATVAAIFAVSAMRQAAASPSASVAPAASASPALASARTQVTIGGRVYRLASDDFTLWRDFMPVAPPGGRPLAAAIHVVVEDGAAFPTTITVDHIWVYGPTAWEPATFEVRRAPEGGTRVNEIEIFANDGPKWDPGTEADIVVQLRSGGSTYLLRIDNVTVRMTS